MARIDDYKESLRIACDRLKQANLHRLARLAGVDIEVDEQGVSRLRVPLLGTSVVVQVGESVALFRETDGGELPLPEQIVVCHYLLHASGEPPTGEMITFRQIPDGHFYFDAFQRRARDPFLATFGKDPELFLACAKELSGEPVAVGDTAMSFRVLPRVPVHLALWRGDEEFPPEASVLFDANVHTNLPAEDIAVVSGMLVYRLMGIARSRSSRN